MTAQHHPGVPVERDGSRAWLGIRYARAHRFGPPELVPFDPDGDFRTYGAAPFQEPPAMPPLGAEPAEDCHFLNVWAPTRPESDALPVYVSVYGGGFEHGSGSGWPQDGGLVAGTGRAIVVSPNYRVGALGFLSLSHLGAPFEGASNLGLRDLVAALTWVRHHIAAFGGDPDRVTVVGESAGGFLAAALPAVRAADGLYHRLSVHSAGASRILPAERAHAMTDTFLQVTRTQENPATLLDLSADQLVQAQHHVVATDIGLRNGPSPQAFGIVDDSAEPDGLLTGHPATAYASGDHRHVDLLVSATEHEIALFREATLDDFDPDRDEDIVAEVAGWHVPERRAREIVATYRAAIGTAAPGLLRERLLTDYIYRLPAARLTQSHAAAGGRAHLLLIGGVDGSPAGHACDAAGLVGRHLPDSTPAAQDRDDAIAGLVLDFVTGVELPWPATGADALTAGSVGQPEMDAAAVFARTLRIWDGVARP